MSAPAAEAVVLDPATLRVAAALVRSRIASLAHDPRLDGLERLGAARALKQLAIDLDISADHVGPRRRRRMPAR